MAQSHVQGFVPSFDLFPKVSLILLPVKIIVRAPIDLNRGRKTSTYQFNYSSPQDPLLPNWLSTCLLLQSCLDRIGFCLLLYLKLVAFHRLQKDAASR